MHNFELCFESNSTMNSTELYNIARLLLLNSGGKIIETLRTLRQLSGESVTVLRPIVQRASAALAVELN